MTAVLILASIFCNVLLTLSLFSLWLYYRKKPRKPQLSLTAEDLLHDLTKGPAVVKIELMPAADLMLRSPRR